MAYAFATLGTLTAIIAFFLIAAQAGRSIARPAELFDAQGMGGTIISIVCTNVTLGTGLVYFISLFDQAALGALGAVTGTLLGYFYLDRLLTRVNFDPATDGNLVSHLMQTKSPSFVFYTYSAMLVLVYIFILAVEIVISTPFIASTLGFSEPLTFSFYTAIIILIIPAIIAFMGGLRGVINTEFLQFILILGLLISLIWLAMMPSVVSGHHPRDPLSFAFTPQGLLVGISAFATAFATQLYNIVNIGLLSKHQSSDFKPIIRISGLIVVGVIVVLATVGAFLPHSDNSPIAFSDLIVRLLAGDSWVHYAISLFLAAGVISVFVSTVDTLAIIITERIYRIPAFNKVIDRSGAHGARLLLLATFLIAVVAVLALINLTTRDIISYLLTALIPLMLFSLFFIAGALSYSKRGKSIFHSKLFSMWFVFLTILIWVVSIIDVFRPLETWNGSAIAAVIWFLGIIFLHREKRSPE